MRAAVARARSGGGPTLVECKTYRLMPHTSDDDDRRYRSPEEVQEWRERDPLPRLRRYLVGRGLLTAEAADAMEIEVRVEIDEAARRAEAAPAPRPETAFRRVYARPLRRTPGVPPELDEAPARPPAAPPRPATGVVRTVLDTVRQTLHDLMDEDERVVVLGEDVGVLGGVFRATDGLYAAFGPKRVIDTPLAESSIVGIGIGLALAGLRPVVEIQFADFMHSAFDQLVSEAAKIHYRSNGDFHVPMVVRAPWGGGGHRGPYHSQAIEAFFAHVAGLKVVCPSTPADVAGMLREAVEDPDPVLFLEHKKTYRRISGLVPEGDWRVPIGLAEVARPGRGPHPGHLRAAPPPLAGGGRGPRRGGLLGGGHRPAHDLAPRPGHRAGVGVPDGSAARRPRGQRELRGGRRGGGHGGPGGVLRPRRPRPPPGHARRPGHALRGRPGGGPHHRRRQASRTRPGPSSRSDAGAGAVRRWRLGLGWGVHRVALSMPKTQTLRRP